MNQPLRHTLKRCIAATLCASIGVTSFAYPTTVYADGLPDLGDVSDAVLSEPQERAIGKRIMLEIRGDRAFVEDPELSDYITALGNRLVAASAGTTNSNRRDFEFFLLNDDTINAFALLGGFIGFHTGLVLASQSESEVAGVMGHEIAHILQRHQARGADGQRKSMPLQLLGLATAILAARSNSSSAGQATEAAIMGSQALAVQSQLDYSRDFEREADRIGINLMLNAGYDPQGMVSFFERLMRANRHNDGKAPGYLRSHPLTTERIADMQNRVDQLKAGGRTNTRTSTQTRDDVLSARVIDSGDYRFAQAKLRVNSLGAGEAISFFRSAIAERTILRNRGDVYGLALGHFRNRDYVSAERELASIRTTNTNPWIENLAAEIARSQRDFGRATTIYVEAMRRFPASRALFFGYVDTLYDAGKVQVALDAVNDRLKSIQDDPRLHELAAKGYERQNKRLAQHRAIGDGYFRRGNLLAAIEQYTLAVKAKDGDFYESSSAESRLRELRNEYRNRPLLPGEKRNTPGDRPDEPETDRSREPRK